MKKIILATFLAGIGSTSALAADLGARAPYAKAPAMMEAVGNWSGFYIGGNVGYGWGNGTTNFAFLPSSVAFGDRDARADLKSNGLIGGAQIGYNWQVGSWLTGIEADIQGSGIKGSSQDPLINLAGVVRGTMSSNEKLSWFGTVRGRLGTLVTPALLLYATGGLAYGQTDNSGDVDPNNGNRFPASISQTKVGWTGGAGAEWMFASRWSAKLEYLYLDLGKDSAVGAQVPAAPGVGVGYTWRTQDHIVRAGVNYHF